MAAGVGVGLVIECYPSKSHKLVSSFLNKLSLSLALLLLVLSLLLLVLLLSSFSFSLSFSLFNVLPKRMLNGPHRLHDDLRPLPLPQEQQTKANAQTTGDGLIQLRLRTLHQPLRR